MERCRGIEIEECRLQIEGTASAKALRRKISLTHSRKRKEVSVGRSGRRGRRAGQGPTGSGTTGRGNWECNGMTL